MKKLNRILSTLALVVVTGTPLLNKPVTATEASLAAPAVYDFNFKYNTTLNKYTFGTSSIGTTTPYFTRTADGVYYDYDITMNSATNSGGLLPQGLEVIMSFQRSDTTWTSFGGLGVSWYSTEQRIGSSASVGTVSNKVYLSFDNQTNKDYYLYLDFNSNGGDVVFRAEYNDDTFGHALLNQYFSFATLNKLIIPSYSKFEFYRAGTSSAVYFDDWYLQDLGISDSYNNGYDDGEADGYAEGYEDGYNNSASPLWDGLEVVVGVTVNFILFIMTLSIFDISLLNIGIVLLSIIGVVWVLKAIRG